MSFVITSDMSAEARRAKAKAKQGVNSASRIASSLSLLAMTNKYHLQGFASLTSNLPSAPAMTKSL
jgi:hypothetical protein